MGEVCSFLQWPVSGTLLHPEQCESPPIYSLNKRIENPQRFPQGMTSKELQYSTLVK